MPPRIAWSDRCGELGGEERHEQGRDVEDPAGTTLGHRDPQRRNSRPEASPATETVGVTGLFPGSG
ncbi:hypothetical protein GCM10009590_05180 [Brachybacterium alimentarium]